MWLDEKFSNCSLATKLLFMYLITCNSIGLTPYHRISDRQITFDTMLDPIQLQIAKEELTSLKWCFFFEGWVYHNHACAYVDYSGRDRVLEAKEKELANIPLKVKEYFNPLITRYKPDRNQKPIIRNQKPETKTEITFQGTRAIIKEIN